MKNTLLLIGITLILLNCFAGLVLESYQKFNWLISSLIILINTILMYYITISRIQKGLKVTLSFIFSVSTLITYAISIKLENKFEDNFLILLIAAILSFQIIVLIISNYLRSIKN